MTPNRWDILEIEWYDAMGDSETADGAKYVAEFKPCIRRTLGYYLGDRLDYVFICETDDRDAQTAPSNVERINAIYKPMVKSVKFFAKGKTVTLDDDEE